MDNSETPIDKLSVYVKLGASLIKELSMILKLVGMEVRDAFKELEKEAVRRRGGLGINRFIQSLT